MVWVPNSLYFIVLILLGDISDLCYFCPVIYQLRLLHLILVASLQSFLYKLDRYHLALLSGVRIGDTLVKLALLVRMLLVVALLLIFVQLFEKFFAVHHFSCRLLVSTYT